MQVVWNQKKCILSSAVTLSPAIYKSRGIAMITLEEKLLWYGTIMHCLYIFGIDTMPDIPFFQPVVSILMITRSILSSGFIDFDEDFLKVFGFCIYLIGACYQCKSLWTPFYYDWCAFGGFLAMGGIILGYFMEGMPTLFVIRFQFLFGLLISGNASLDCMMQPESVDFFSVVLPLGLQNLVLFALLVYISEKRGLYMVCATS